MRLPRRVRSVPLRWFVGFGSLATVAAATIFVLGLPAERLDRADKLASVGSLLLGVAALLVSAVALRTGAKQGLAAITHEYDARLSRATEDLAAAVKRQWSQEAGLRHLRRPRPLRVRWSTTRRPVSAPAEAVLGQGTVPGRPTRLRLRGDVHDVLHLFRQLPARQMVILGEPGAGKTAMAVLLTLRLLESRTHGEAVPMLLPLSSWNPGMEDFHEWLVRRLIEDYPALNNTTIYPPQAAHRLVQTGQIIPILDGLDELAHSSRATALAQLDIGRGPFTLTSRGDDYQDAVTASGEFLRRAAVVEIEPIDVEDTAAFLNACQLAGDDRWSPVAEKLCSDPDGPLARALSTPLMVQLARATYAAPVTSPSDLCDKARFGSQEVVEQHLLESYLPAAFAASAYEPGSATKWLAFLAWHLHQQEAHDLAWWHIERSMPRLMFGLVAGGFGGITVTLTLGPVAGLPAALAAGLSGWLVAVVAWWLIRHRYGVPTRRFRLQHLISHLATGVLLGLSAGMLSAGPGGPYLGLAVGVTVGLAEGLVAGGIGGYGTRRSGPTAAMRPLSPRSALRLARTAALRQTATATLVSFVGAAIALSLYPIPYTDRAWLAAGMGFAGGLLIGFDTAYGRLILAQLLLAFRRRLPRNLMRFLDDAHRLGVLRQAGAVYQFRHARLRDWLASRFLFVTNVTAEDRPNSQQ